MTSLPFTGESGGSSWTHLLSKNYEYQWWIQILQEKKACRAQVSLNLKLVVALNPWKRRRMCERDIKSPECAIRREDRQRGQESEGKSVHTLADFPSISRPLPLCLVLEWMKHPKALSRKSCLAMRAGKAAVHTLHRSPRT